MRRSLGCAADKSRDDLEDYEEGTADRIGRIRLVKESCATDVENRLVMLARSGQLRQKLNEEQLKELLRAVAENQERDGEYSVAGMASLAEGRGGLGFWRLEGGGKLRVGGGRGGGPIEALLPK